jgi:hypothetical protein
MKTNKFIREKRSKLRQKLGSKLDRLAQSVKDAEYGVLIGKNTPEQVAFANHMLMIVRERMVKLNRGVAKQRAWVRGREF